MRIERNEKKLYYLNECIIVEGVYDKIKLSGFIGSAIFVTHGFSIFNNKKDIETIKTFAEKCGVVILTDSDAAGFKIRNYIKQCLPKECVKHAYIPEIEGKEKRKTKPGKEGILGVEGISEEIIITALKNAGCNFQQEKSVVFEEKVTKSDFFMLGLSGGVESTQKRDMICKKLNLPGKISANMLISAVNLIMSRDDFFQLCDDIFNENF